MFENRNKIPNIYYPYFENVMNNGVSFMCGQINYVNKYQIKDIQIDENDGYRYVIYDGKRLYMRNDVSNDTILKIVNDLITEQQEKSPHRYLTDEFNVCEGDVVFDVGCAEGNFSLTVSDVAQEIHMFEYDEKWIEALQRTFGRLSVESHITKGYISNVTSRNKTSLTIDDYCIQNKIDKIDMLKVDVEGAELELLEGANNMLNEHRIGNICIATYHKLDDFEKIKEILEDREYDVTNSEGYLLFSHISERIEDIRPPFFVKGLIRARIK